MLAALAPVALLELRAILAPVAFVAPLDVLLFNFLTRKKPIFFRHMAVCVTSSNLSMYCSA